MSTGKNSRYEQMFRDDPVWKAILAMAVPSLLTIIIMIFYNMADMFFIARLGDTAKVASVSVIAPVFNIIMALATMIGVGGSALIANAFGAKDMEKARNISSLCFYSAVLLGLAVTVLLFLLQTPLLRILGTTPEMWEDSHTYLSILSCGTVFMLISSAMGMLVRSEGAVKEGMYGNLADTLTNIVLDPLFILTFGWGVAGAAAATVIGNMVSSCYYVIFVHRRASVISLEVRRAFVMPREIFPIVALGVPNAASTVLSGFAAGAILVSLLRQGLLLIPLLIVMHSVFGLYGLAGAHMAADMGAAVISAFIFFKEYRRAMREMP